MDSASKLVFETFEHTLNHLLDHAIDLSHFEVARKLTLASVMFANDSLDYTVCADSELEAGFNKVAIFVNA